MTFDRKTIWLAVSLFVVLVLAAVNLAGANKPTWPAEWYELSPHDSKSGKPSISFAPDTFWIDLPQLDLASLNGRVKFLSFAKPTWEKCPIGYVIDLDALPIPKDKVPEKYKQTKTFDSPAGLVTIPPLDEATYEVHFEFHLIDPDGFEIVTVNSPKHLVQSGQTERIQSQTEPAVTIAQANRVATVKVDVTVDTCVSAEDE
jgi:hypothetical protein